MFHRAFGRPSRKHAAEGLIDTLNYTLLRCNMCDSCVIHAFMAALTVQ